MNGMVTLGEAARLLGTYDVDIHRRVKRGDMGAIYARNAAGKTRAVAVFEAEVELLKKAGSADAA